jgi:DNA-binding NarL/FixJ family response regulator
MEPISVLVVDDHALTREAILSLIGGQKDFRVVGEAASGQEAVRQAAIHRPRVIVMDILMPGMNGIEAARTIHTTDPTVRILVLSNHTGKKLLEAVLEAGAVGYVRKDRAYEEIIPAIRAAAGGRRYIGYGVDN